MTQKMQGSLRFDGTAVALVLTACFILPAELVLAASQSAPVPQPASPQKTASVFSVSGVVLDPSDAAVSGATIILRGAHDRVERSAHADAIGGFRFDGVTAGTYEVRVDKSGFKS